MIVLAATIPVMGQNSQLIFPNHILLSEGWQLQSSFVVKEDGAAISVATFKPERWLTTTVPSTVLNALTKNGVYPDIRFALNAFRVPDASDEFNQKENIAQYSHLPGKRNPWTDPWWFRTTFNLPRQALGTRTWLHFDSINYRAEVWLNGNQVADREHMVSMNQRFVFDVSRWAATGNMKLLSAARNSLSMFNRNGQL
jgi:hypothetical protein